MSDYKTVKDYLDILKMGTMSQEVEDMIFDKLKSALLVRGTAQDMDYKSNVDFSWLYGFLQYLNK
jgi:hypothetical protein